MPWLTGTAFLHSVMIQEKRGMLKHWNMALIILTYSLVIFGTFLTRSGVLSSVHAFAQSAIGPAFFAFIGATFITSLTLLLKRWDELKSENQMSNWLSREGLFLMNNLLFMGILAVCFSGVIYPIISELVTGQKVTVGPPFYERATGPLFAGLLLLMGIAPLAAWRHSTFKTLGKAAWKPFLASLLVPILASITGTQSWPALLGFWLCAQARHRKSGESYPLALWRLAGRNRRRYGGYVIHIGVVLMAIGIIGIEIFQQETQGTIPQGDELTLGNYTVRYDQLDEFPTPDGRVVARATISVFKDGEFVTVLHPRRDFYVDSQQPMTIPGVVSTMENDFYVILVDWQPISTTGATFKVYNNPLVNWLWLGGLVFILGTLIAAWPDKDPEIEPARARRTRVAAAEA
jgi:cytochrome c-type biogenesis protein CcmF